MKTSIKYYNNPEGDPGTLKSIIHVNIYKFKSLIIVYCTSSVHWTDAFFIKLNCLIISKQLKPITIL